METIKTATGKEYACESFSVIHDPFRVYIRLRGVSITEVARVFSDQEETKQLYYGNEYLAYCTTLLSIIPENGMIRVTLTKE